MNRNYSIEDIRECLIHLRERAPRLNVVTDIIVGFPGEAEDNFLKTIQLIKDISFEYVYVFGYEDRDGAVSCGMGEKISEKVISSRKRMLVRMLKKKAAIRDMTGKMIQMIK